MKMRILAIAGVLALVAIMVAPMAVFATDAISATEITGTVPSVIAITPPADFAMPSLVPGTTVESTTAKIVTVQSNGAWELDIKGNNDGTMETTALVPLHTAMDVKGGDVAAYTALTGTNQALKTGVPGSTDVNDIYFQQTVAFNDAPGNYSILIFFTATPIP